MTAATAVAQSGTVTFGGTTNGSVPTVSFSGPALSVTSQIRAGFGNTAGVGTAQALWWTSQYSGQGMLYGNNSSSGNVLEVRLAAGSGFDLFLTGALFGGWPNTARNVSYRLFSDDYSQSTALQTVLTGTVTPADATFPANGWGSAIRIQFTETNAAGAFAGRGAFDVGIQDIDYTVRATTSSVVPEPSTFLLMGSGLVTLIAYRRRRTR